MEIVKIGPATAIRVSAYRTAGAAVIALLSDRDIARISIGPDGTGELALVPNHVAFNGPLQPELRSAPKLTIEMAANASEVRLCFGTPGPGSVPARDRTGLIADGLGNDELDGIWAHVWVLVEDFVCWSAIIELAEALVNLTTLDGPAATALVRHAMETELALAEAIQS